MSLKIGIVGLPNVGKSTLFNALVKNAQAEASNYPFCTIDPNVGVVEVPDSRLDKLAEISKSQKIVPTVIEFIDIAGLVKNAHQGEGLGNQFLSHIRETDAIAMVVRFFENGNIIHVDGAVNPQNDIKTIELELILTDLDQVEKKIGNMRKEIKAGEKNAALKLKILEKIKEGLEHEIPVRKIITNQEDFELIKDTQLITSKPVLYIANVSEEMAAVPLEKLRSQYNLSEDLDDSNFVQISAKIESELSELPEQEQNEYLDSLGLDKTGLNRLIQIAYKTLDLSTFLTSGEKETKAWTIKSESTAPQAAGKIHTDFEKGFIAADVIKYDDFVANNGWQGTKEKGLIKTEGKNYIVKDGDVIIFKFNV